jgi:hypothetical protein
VTRQTAVKRLLVGLSGLIGFLLLGTKLPWVGVVIFVMIPVVLAYFWHANRAARAAKEKRKREEAAAKYQQDMADGVIAVWEILRISETQLIEGYTSNAPRHSLAGLTATVETTGTVITEDGGYRMNNGVIVGRRTTTRDERQVHVRIEGPQGGFVYTVKLKDNPEADAKAREFAAQLNRASRQLQRGTLTMPVPPPGRGNYNATRAHPLSSPLPPPVPPPSVPAAWYPDPNDGQMLRYWDGTTWTELITPVNSP